MPDPDRNHRKAAAAVATLAWLEGIDRTEGYPALVAAIEDAIRSGMAQGEADALALAADRQGRRGFVVARAFRAAYARLAGDRDVTRRARDTLNRIRDGAATDTGRNLADAGDGGEQDMATAAADGLSGDGSASRWTDWALWAAFGAGALALYQKAAAASGGDRSLLMNFWTAGDERVCFRCEAYETGNPYTPGDFPSLPVHPRCRCVGVAADPLPNSFLDAFLS